MRDKPFPPEWPVREALDAYLEENGFTIAVYDDRFTPAKVLGITFQIPNTKRHRWALMWHDLHHAVTGYGTDPAGEAEISAWETQRGLRPLGLYVGTIVLAGIAMGIVSPRRTLRAWKDAPGDESLFHEPLEYDTCLEMTLGDLRDHLGVPREGLFRGKRGLHAAAPASA